MVTRHQGKMNAPWHFSNVGWGIIENDMMGHIGFFHDFFFQPFTN